MRFALLVFFLTSLSAASTQTRYEALDPTSVREHLAFYELYKDTPEGKKALEYAWKLLSGDNQQNTPFFY